LAVLKVATGVDLIEIERIQAVVARHGQRYLERVFTPAEREICGVRAESLAARFAAKEAVSKALGCGIGEVSFQEIEVLQDEKGAPHLVLHGAATEKAAALGLTTWSVSLSHSQSHAIAMVTAIGAG
jgi:holo-[acyl-carrier protein] synthase